MHKTTSDMFRALARALFIVLVGAQGLSACTSMPDAPLPTVESLDLPRYMGRWYEIAKLPNRFQGSCSSDTVARYRLSEQGVDVVNACRRADGSISSIHGRATAVPHSGGARLRVSFFWPIFGDYWVLALDPSYETALVGTPSRKYAWILSRKPVLDDASLRALLARAQALGFDSNAFVRTRQAVPIPDDGGDSN